MRKLRCQEAAGLSSGRSRHCVIRNSKRETYGYNDSITFTKPPAVPSNDQQHKKRRRRNVLWYNPPYSADVQSNVTKMFYAIIDKCFPEDHPYLGKLFNRKNMKLAYSTTRNVDAIIASHNKKILNSSRCRDVNPGTRRQGNNPIRCVSAELRLE